MTARQTTGVDGLDELLGGGLLPGTLTVVVGATGIGKTQLGLQFAQAGVAQEKRRGVVFDCSSRGDSQNHAAYAQRMFDARLAVADVNRLVELDDFFAASKQFGDYLHVFDYSGQRVTRKDLDWDDWRNWQAHLNARLRAAISFLYGNLVQGSRRIVIDGIEPVDRPGESIQFHLFEYVYHQVLRKDPEWVARDLFREHYRQNAEAAAAHVYDPAQVGCVLLVTSHETMLDDLISRPLAEGDVLSNANTLIYMGKTRNGDRMGRSLFVAKHRGSACDERIVPYRIDDRGVHVG
ncbi:RAD55 family ATPase [Anatilimnocola floriformis]|uniref:RAD55 family ATPase n=1 Tax=Anatilimnocola floriformis TaxID=2948575 RepID=UPI0020C5AB7C|nr:ATPase domain-containing protein [Anatilimnocola floriformis]